MSVSPGGKDSDGGALALSEARLRRAQAVARLGSWEIDFRTRTMWGSDEAFRIYGLALTPDRLLPLAVAQEIPLPEYRAQLDRALADLMSGTRPYDLLFRIRRHDDGAIREVHSFAQLVRDAEGKAILISGTIQDVTEQEERARAMLEAVRASEEQARIAIEQAQLRQRMDSIGTLAAGIAHDFNNVLAGIMGYADVLRVEPSGLGPLQREGVEAILQSCQRAADLVSGLQNLSRPGLGEPGGFDLHEVAAEVMLVLRETTDRLVAKESAIPEGRYAVHGSASALYHALMNLGVNAIQAIEQKGAVPGDRLSIEAEDYVADEGDRLGLQPGRYVHVVVRDTGSGMSPEVRRQAFDPLFSTKEKGDRKGQGLGLAMVYNVVVRQHAGAIEVESVEGKGTAFHLYLPAGEPGTRRIADESTVPVQGTETVLVVDDEPLIAKLTRRVLERAGYTVLTAGDGAEAVELFAERGAGIDVVVLDRTLPRLRGEAVLARMRELRPDVRVIVSSGDSSGAAQLPGADAVLGKPYTPTRLCEVIRRVLDR